MPGPKPQGQVRSAPTPRKDRRRLQRRSGRRNVSSSGGLVSYDPWEQEGSDMLPRGQGTVTTTALSRDSVYLLVLAIKMASNILSEYPIRNGGL